MAGGEVEGVVDGAGAGDASDPLVEVDVVARVTPAVPVDAVMEEIVAKPHHLLI